VGFFDSPTIIVRFTPSDGAMPRSALGTFILDPLTGDKYITTTTPKFPKPCKVTVEVSLNGKDFTFNGKGYRCYDQPLITSVTPRFSSIKGGVVVTLESEHLFNSKDVMIRFTDASGYKELVKGEVVVEDYGDGSSATTGGEDGLGDLPMAHVTCITPAFNTTLPLPQEVTAELTMNGYYYQPIPLRHPFIYHDVVVSTITPSIIPADGMSSQLSVVGSSFFDGISGRVTVYYYGNDDGSNSKATTFPMTCDDVNHLRFKVPSTRYVLGRDDGSRDAYKATLELLAGPELLSPPYPFLYYNDPSYSLSHPHGPYTGGQVLHLLSKDRALHPSFTPIVRFAAADGSWSVDLPAVSKIMMTTTTTTTTATPPPPSAAEGDQVPHEEEVEQLAVDASTTNTTTHYLEVTTPPLPDLLRQPPTDPPTMVPITITTSLNALTYTTYQQLSYHYYDQPVLKEIAPNEAFPGDVITVKGSGLFETTSARVRLTSNDGATIIDIDAQCSGTPPVVQFTLPTTITTTTTTPLPWMVATMGLAMDGETFTCQPLESGAKSTFKVVLQDPTKRKKK